MYMVKGDHIPAKKIRMVMFYFTPDGDLLTLYEGGDPDMFSIWGNVDVPYYLNDWLKEHGC